MNLIISSNKVAHDLTIVKPNGKYIYSNRCTLEANDESNKFEDCLEFCRTYMQKYVGNEYDFNDYDFYASKEYGLDQPIYKINDKKVITLNNLHFCNAEYAKKRNEQIEKEKCVLCLEKNSFGSQRLGCGHAFHEECINEVKDKKCPLCRKEITEMKDCKNLDTYRKAYENLKSKYLKLKSNS